MAGENELCKHLMWTHTGDFPVYLGSVLTLRVRVFGSCHLQHTHPEGIDIHGLVVVLLVHLRRHELGRACSQKICLSICLFKALKRIHSTSENINVKSNKRLYSLFRFDKTISRVETQFKKWDASNFIAINVWDWNPAPESLELIQLRPQFVRQQKGD